jgi:hypothetical protein
MLGLAILALPAVLTSNLDSQQSDLRPFPCHPVRVKSKARDRSEAQPND